MDRKHQQVGISSEGGYSSKEALRPAFDLKAREPTTEFVELRDVALAGVAEAPTRYPVEDEYAPETLPHNFVSDFQPRDYFSAASGEEVYEVRLLVAPECAPSFRRKTYHHTQRIEEERPKGWAVVSFEVEGLEEIRAFVRSWGPGVVVMKPAVLARQIKSDAEALLRHYPHVRTR